MSVFQYFSREIIRTSLDEIMQVHRHSQKGIEVAATVKEIKDVVHDEKKVVYHLLLQYAVGEEKCTADYVLEIKSKSAAAKRPKKGDQMMVFTGKSDIRTLHNPPNLFKAWMIISIGLIAPIVLLTLVILWIVFQSVLNIV